MKQTLQTKITMPLVILALAIAAFFGFVAYSLNVQIARLQEQAVQAGQADVAAREVFRSVQSGILTGNSQYLVTAARNSLDLIDALEPLSREYPGEIAALIAMHHRYYAALVSVQSLAMENRRKELEERLNHIETTFGEMDEALAVFQSQLSERRASTIRQINVLSIVLVIILAGTLCTQWRILAKAVAPARTAQTVLHDVAAGNLTLRLPVRSQDEIGEMSSSVNSLIDRLQGIIQHVAGGVNTVASSSTELAATATQLASGAEETTNQSAQVAAAAEELSTNMSNMSASSEQMSTNVNAVSAAVEQVTASIGEMAKSAERAASAAANATQLVDASNSQIGELGNAADEIGKVIEVIQDIAEQTNLLALNATIEAARAGDAGKGFAVVATEVKELAKQTAGATEDIRKRIEGIQGSTGLAVKSMGGIGDVIRQVNDLSRTIASAVEEQSITTREIAGNLARSSTAAQTVAKSVTESASASREIARIVVGVDQAARQSAQGASQTQLTGRELSTVAEQLRSLVGQFKV